MPPTLRRPSLDISSQQIRLIELQPGQSDDEVICNFLITSLQNDPKPIYEALSYAWGDETVTTPINIEGCSYQVTTNLAAALNAVRKRNEARILWVDALCINQEDGVEKSQQVGIMGEIYSKATRCVVWLGDFQSLGCTEVGAKSAFDIVQELAYAVNVEIGVPWNIGIKTLESLISSPWWTRIWTVQEIVLAPSAVIHCGSLSMEWSVFQKAAETVVFYNLVPIYPGSDALSGHWFSGPIIGIQTLQRERKESHVDLLHRFRYREATDPRDKIYGVMGLLPSPPIFIDYSFSVEEVYKEVTIQLITISNNLKVFIGKRGEKKQIPGLPSWAVDWTRPKDPSQRWERYWDHCLRYESYNADRSENVYLKVNDSVSTMSLQGLKVDTVKLAGAASMQGKDGDVLTEGNLPASVLHDTISRWKPLATSCFGINDCPYIGGGSWQNAFWRTIAGDLITISGYPNRKPSDQDAQDFDLFCEWQDPESLEDKFALYDSLRSNIVNQSFFITKNKWMGIGPPTVKEGDEVWILFGGKVPFLLRPVDGVADTFTLLGDGYLHGIMQGQAMDRWKEKKKTVKLR